MRKRDKLHLLEYYGKPYHEWLSDHRDSWRRSAKVAPGIPVPGSGRNAWHSKKNRAGRNNGVSSGSRVLQHHYMDEGDKGQHIRRKVRRIERAIWLTEVQEELSNL